MISCHSCDWTFLSNLAWSFGAMSLYVSLMLHMTGMRGMSKGIGGSTGGDEWSNSLSTLRKACIIGSTTASDMSSGDWSMTRGVTDSRSTRRSYSEQRSA